MVVKQDVLAKKRKSVILNKGSFVYQAGVLAMSNMLLLLLNFIYRIILGRLAGPEGLGVYTLSIQMYSILMSMCVSGMTVAITNLSAVMQQNNDYNGISRMMRFAILCFAILIVGLSIPIVIFKNQIAQNILGDARTARSLIMILLCIALTGLENLTKALFNGSRQVKYTAISELGEQFLRIVFAAYLLSNYINGDHGQTSFLILLGMTLSEFYSVIFLGINYIRKVAKNKTCNRFNGFKKKEYIKIAFPATCTALLATVFSSLSTIIFPQRLLLVGYTHQEAISSLGLISGMVMPILMLPSALISALCTLLMPGISACVGKGDQKELKRKVNKGLESASLLGLPATMLILPFTSLFCTLLFGQTAPFAMAALLAAGVIITYYLMITTSILNGLGKQKQVLLFAAGAEILQLALVWVLCAIPTLHVYGYILGIITGDFLRAIIGLIYIRKVTNTLPGIFNSLIVPVATSILLYCSVRLLFFYFTAAGATILSAALLSLFICVMLYLLLLRMMGINAIGYLNKVVLRRPM